jgi:uncharacterized protein (TIGR00645 family)
LIVAQGVYVYQFMHELALLITQVGTLTEAQVMLIVLGLIDVVMIANLLIMVIIGGYETFVSRLDLRRQSRSARMALARQCWRAQGQAGNGLIGISSIHLLKTFINAEHWLTESSSGKWHPHVLPDLRLGHCLD